MHSSNSSDITVLMLLTTEQTSGSHVSFAAETTFDDLQDGATRRIATRAHRECSILDSARVDPKPPRRVPLTNPLHTARDFLSGVYKQSKIARSHSALGIWVLGSSTPCHPRVLGVNGSWSLTRKVRLLAGPNEAYYLGAI